MKTIKKILIIIAILLCSVTASAYDFEVDGIYYNIISASDLTVEVTGGYNKYTGKVIIPSNVVYKSKVLTVTNIGSNAFDGCSSLTSITIPNSVTTIISGAFSGCTALKELRIENGEKTLSLEDVFYSCPLKTLYLGRNLTYMNEDYSPSYKKTTLTSVTIGNSVTFIENNMFEGCTALKELRIEDGEKTLSLGYNYDEYDKYWEGLFYDCPLETLYLGRNLSYNTGYYYGHSPFYNKTALTSVTIGNSVTLIGDYAFDYCSGLTSVTIGSGVTTIGDYAFGYCSGLTSITIPNSVTSIGDYAFSGCSSLTSITIPNSVTLIRDYAFSSCSSLTSITIPNSVTTIGEKAFNYCSGLTSITIPNSVTSIGDYAFYNCTGLTSIHLSGETPPNVYYESFTQSHYAGITLFVPKGSLETYQAADTRKYFWDIREEGTTETPEIEVKKCATPVITYSNSGLDITTETDDAEIHTKITCGDVGSYHDDRIDLSAIYNITSYATKSGYLNSETATVTLCWIAASGDSEDTSIINVEAKPVVVTCNNSTINICGGEEGAEVIVYTTSGVAVSNTTIINGNAVINTSFTKGDIVILNIAGKGIKIVMQ